jgi:hypothetical protein
MRAGQNDGMDDAEDGNANALFDDDADDDFLF